MVIKLPSKYAIQTQHVFGIALSLLLAQDVMQLVNMEYILPWLCQSFSLYTFQVFRSIIYIHRFYNFSGEGDEEFLKPEMDHRVKKKEIRW